MLLRGTITVQAKVEDVRTFGFDIDYARLVTEDGFVIELYTQIDSLRNWYVGDNVVLKVYSRREGHKEFPDTDLPLEEDTE
jgi:hypothetical protein